MSGPWSWTFVARQKPTLMAADRGLLVTTTGANREGQRPGNKLAQGRASPRRGALGMFSRACESPTGAQQIMGGQCNIVSEGKGVV